MPPDDLNKSPNYRNWLIDERAFKKKPLLIICLIGLLTLIFHCVLVYSFNSLKLSQKTLVSKVKQSKQDYELVYYEPHPFNFVEVNFELDPESPPENTINFAARSQQAAQENPGLPSLEEIPTLQGEAEIFSKIAPQTLISQEMIPEIADPLESSDLVEPELHNGLKLRERPKPKSRPKLNSSQLGSFKKNEKAVSKYGITAVNARFTQFGEYIQKMHEAIIYQARLLFINSSLINVEFDVCISLFYTLDETGNVTNIGIESSTASNLANILCKDAILSQAPFGPWTDDMKAILNKEEKFHFDLYIN